jgi:hypothetical protein
MALLNRDMNYMVMQHGYILKERMRQDADSYMRSGTDALAYPKVYPLGKTRSFSIHVSNQQRPGILANLIYALNIFF